ncbi:hypothetical protein [Methylobacterium sp. PvR107]|uniref:hypothetical protein n=1 Tax=Methylobacterium sp. PvR107 TaxID=2806597 RepID=UPI001AE80917|nr:hypothetical protein [Methylobacterium sp. PvR107]MBP1182484.1 hypothetical protein [Methylobacterium sp. PvR107]
MRGLLCLLWCLWAQAGLAQGFAIHDLTQVAEAVRTSLGSGSTAQAKPEHLILTCTAFAGAPTAELQLGRLSDGTEQRVRSGKTSFGALEALCMKRNPDCRLSGLPAGPAIGWITVYALGYGGGATAVILRDGDLLSIDARATSRGSAEDAVQRLAQSIMPRIVGP